MTGSKNRVAWKKRLSSRGYRFKSYKSARMPKYRAKSYTSRKYAQKKY